MPVEINIAAQLRDALLECFAATTRLTRPTRPELRSQVVYVGGTVSIAHNSP